jgi:hypothetical protein
MLGYLAPFRLGCTVREPGAVQAELRTSVVEKGRNKPLDDIVVHWQQQAHGAAEAAQDRGVSDAYDDNQDNKQNETGAGPRGVPREAAAAAAAIVAPPTIPSGPQRIMSAFSEDDVPPSWCE